MIKYQAGPVWAASVGIRLTGKPDDVAAIAERLREFFTVLDEGGNLPAHHAGEVTRYVIVAADQSLKRDADSKS